ncbi:hypothetical protein ABT063_24300 [Streptomyces sp. NPDC002838]|uniref:hypothetical protein n=1 Tax=Streptomyces sp. NPDC002838 TaxID=3154436 RepID=UPI0033198689
MPGLRELAERTPPQRERHVDLLRAFAILHDPVLARDVLESLRRKLDGGEAAVETLRRKRKMLVHALHYAVERGELGSHPLNKVRWRVPKPAVGGPAGGSQASPGTGSAERRLLFSAQ